MAGEREMSQVGTLWVESQQFLGWFCLSFGVYAATAQTSKPAYEGILGLVWDGLMVIPEHVGHSSN